MMFDFVCPYGHEFEELVPPHLYYFMCPTCGTLAERQISPVRIDRSAIALTKGASPESIAHFDRIHRQRKAIEDRAYERHGDYGKAAGSD